MTKTMTMTKRRFAALWLLALCLLLLPVAASAAAPLPSAPDNGYVLDQAQVLSQATVDHILAQNRKLTDQTGAAIVVVTMEFIGSAGTKDYAYSLFNTWGVGSKTENNGVLLLLVTGTGKFWCVQGKGLEQKLTSGNISDILDDYLATDFDAGRFDAGVLATFDQLYSRLGIIYGLTDGQTPGGQGRIIIITMMMVTMEIGGAVCPCP